MIYCSIDDIRDELLKQLVTEDDLQEASDEIDDLARSLNVNPARIPNPVPNTVKKLAAALTLTITARNSSLMNAGGDGEDAYEKKRQVWAKEVDRLSKMITQEVLLGGKPPEKRRFPCVMEMKRA
ncbi:hypothetical protein M7775_15435 [Sporomusa sphaeroides DSM 2875]|uniref:hypothetical protein n=1 Tax=Sporomusa sphaeroides TaxID=47679 RepID=UPI00202FA722|nr:hypothetical protein [Sporomusa sphaeroides]MCM0759950.1 hypothetical protein [Sporomusa sphaeroides DSM 2875]